MTASADTDVDVRFAQCGAVTSLPAGGIALGGGKVSPQGSTGIVIDFPDGTKMTANAHFWSYGNVWYLNVRAYNTQATDGIMGVLKPGDWTSPGFSDKWRVSKRTSTRSLAGTRTVTRAMPGRCHAPRPR